MYQFHQSQPISELSVKAYAQVLCVTTSAEWIQNCILLEKFLASNIF